MNNIKLNNYTIFAIILIYKYIINPTSSSHKRNIYLKK